jgi:hypothetical protein
MSAGHAFVRPGQVAPDLPAPDNCVRCGLTEAAHQATPRIDGSIGEASFVACDGSGILTPADVLTVLSALADAAVYRNTRADDRDAADVAAYRRLSRALGGAR